MRHRLSLPADFAALDQLEAFIESVVPNASASMKMQVGLAVHEICINIVEHGYAGDPGTIQVEGEQHGAMLYLSILDHARNVYYPPDQVLPPDIDTDIDLLPESGWGIFIVHQVMTSVHYEHSESGNRWQLAKQMDETPEQP